MCLSVHTHTLKLVGWHTERPIGKIMMHPIMFHIDVQFIYITHFGGRFCVMCLNSWIKWSRKGYSSYQTI